MSPEQNNRGHAKKKWMRVRSAYALSVAAKSEVTCPGTAAAGAGPVPSGSVSILASMTISGVVFRRIPYLI